MKGTTTPNLDTLLREAGRGSQSPDLVRAAGHELDELIADANAAVHPTQRKILDVMRGDRSVKWSPTMLADEIPDVSLPAISYHVRRLKARGRVVPAGERPARGAVEHFYELAPTRARRRLRAAA